MQDSGFSFSGCTTLMLLAEAKISLRVEIFADNLTKGQFLGRREQIPPQVKQSSQFMKLWVAWSNVLWSLP